MRHILILVSAISLAACTSSPGGAPLKGSTGTATRAQSSAAPVTAPSQSVREARFRGIMGANGQSLLERFGKARIDLKEGSARKLQFAGETCVLDIFLYPAQTGRDPVATYMDARNRNTGEPMDSASCARVLAKRPSR